MRVADDPQSPQLPAAPRVVSGGAIGPVDATVVPRFAGPATFARLPRLDEVTGADVAVVGVPFGAQQVADAGDIAANPFNIGQAISQIQDASLLTSSGMRLLTICGDHTIALLLLRTMAALHGPFAVLHFDAHLDTWDTYFVEPYTHGTPFRRASEEGLIDLEHSMHVGIRGPLYSSADLSDTERIGFATLPCADLETAGLSSAIERMRGRLADAPVYVSVDIDVLDPALAPGTGTPEAGGMTSRELLAMLRELKDLRIVSADIVEVAPAYDHAELTGIAAAHVGFELLSAMADTPPPAR